MIKTAKQARMLRNLVIQKAEVPKKIRLSRILMMKAEIRMLERKLSPEYLNSLQSELDQKKKYLTRLEKEDAAMDSRENPIVDSPNLV